MATIQEVNEMIKTGVALHIIKENTELLIKENKKRMQERIDYDDFLKRLGVRQI